MSSDAPRGAGAASTHLPGCYSCDHDLVDAPPPRDAVVASAAWRVVHAFDSSLPGWLVVLPRRHVLSMAQLNGDEAAELGPLLADLGRALAGVVGCEKTYVMQFSEAPGFSHLHLHLVPRMPDQPTDRRGPAVFGYLGQPEGARVPEQEQDRLALALAAVLRR